MILVSIQKTQTFTMQRTKKILGKMKDKTKSNPSAEFVALKSKIYSLITSKNKVEKGKKVNKIAFKNES